MAANGAVITEFEEMARGQFPAKKTTLANTVSTVAVSSGTLIHPIGVVRSDGQKRTSG